MTTEAITTVVIMMAANMTMTSIIRRAFIAIMAIASTIPSSGTTIMDGMIPGTILGMDGMLLTSVWATTAGLAGAGDGITIPDGTLHGIITDGMAAVTTQVTIMAVP